MILCVAHSLKLFMTCVLQSIISLHRRTKSIFKLVWVIEYIFLTRCDYDIYTYDLYYRQSAFLQSADS